MLRPSPPRGSVCRSWPGRRLCPEEQRPTGGRSARVLSQGLDLRKPFLGRDHAEEAERLVPDILELVLFVLWDVHDVAGADLVDLPPQEDAGPAFQDHDALIVQVVLERRLPAGRDLEVTHGEVLRAVLRTDEDVAAAPGAGPAAPIRFLLDPFPGDIPVPAHLPVDDPHGRFPHMKLGTAPPWRFEIRSAMPR